MWERASPVNCSWDAENRLTCVQSGDPNSPADGDTKVEFVYDYLGRRVEKQVSEHNGTSWSVSDRRRFVYSDWLPVLELDAGDPNDVTILRKYTWGLDLSGQSGGSASSRSIQDAGGIGGLLATEDVADTKDYYYLYDANGNVGQVLDADDGSIETKYEYDAYGNNLLDPTDPNESGPYAAENPFRFSTKYWDDETGLGYWGYRYYSPRLGRWINRDPIGEPGAMLTRGIYSGRSFVPRDPSTSEEPHTYAYVYNDPIRQLDPLGLCCDMADCKKKLQKALQDPRIKKMIEEAKKLKHWWGMPCFGRVRCTCLCGKNTLGWADPLSGDALICARNTPCLSQSKFNDVVREEIAHQMLMCGNINDWLWSCSGCMREEKRAKYLAGLCKTNLECTQKAWSTCRSHLGCKGKEWEDFINVGWPPDLEGQEPFCSGGRCR